MGSKIEYCSILKNYYMNKVFRSKFILIHTGLAHEMGWKKFLKT